MTQQFENLLYLFGASACGASTEKITEFDVDEIRKAAIKQGVWTVVYPVLSKCCDASIYREEVYGEISRWMIRREITLNATRELEKSGIPCCCLKGAVIAELYNCPECRASGDVDVLIDASQEKQTAEILTNLGFDVKPRLSNHHAMCATHPVGGLMEIHVRLHGEIDEKILLNHINIQNEPWEPIVINGETYHTLGVNDNLMYLTAHYIKHLVNSGGGVRQMMDLLLFIEKNKERIDFEKYESILKELKYDKLIDVIKSIGAKYFGFDYEIKEEALMEKILTDTEEGGIFGKFSETRKTFYQDYCEERSDMSKYGTKIYMAVKKESGSLSWWLPKQETLIKAYGFRYAKCKLLIPVAWVHRYLRVLWRKWMARNKPKRTPEQEERLTLMRELGMIE